MTDPQDLQLSRIGQIAVTVHDVERAVAFYRDTIGMPFLFQVPGMAFFQCGEVRLMLAVPTAPELDHPASLIYYRVHNIHAAHRTMEERGVPFERAPQLTHRDHAHELWTAFFKDPDGNLLALMSEVPVT